MISIQDFAQTQLKIGRVISVDEHPAADKLMIIRVDLGEETPRTLVAGLKAYYAPEELVGKLIVVVANLEPARLRGVESQGMLLAAQDGEKVVVLTVDQDVAPGSVVR